LFATVWLRILTGMVRREVVLDVPPAELWRALADAEALSAWFGADASGSLAPGAQVRFRFPDGTERAAAVEEVEPERRVAFRWLPFERLADGSTRPRPVTRVELLVEDEGDRSVLVIVERDLSMRARTAG